MTVTSDVTTPTLPRTWRPFGPRLAAPVFALFLVGAFAWLWLSFDQQTRDAINVIERGTVIAIVGVGVALLYAMARSRVTVTEDGITLVNGYRRRDFAWAEIEKVRMPLGAPWPNLDLADGRTIPMLGIQGSDGGRAKTAVREVKALVAAHRP
ncbi:PH domain-containing protein [Nocardioides sambongensis]|uniref:PH domain-containing protein n=1 Tax=Nocardioides sambongensis TaxID=2589074 RepID=UPI00112B1AF8|nr:PH domain-containing protein [Nocardioides sambongensis]